MGFILAALITFVAIIAIGIVWRQNRREIRRLRNSHDKAVRELSHEHHRRLERLDREQDRKLRVAHHPLVRDLLPALDSLDEALDHLEKQDVELSPEDIAQGLELARDSIDDALARHDIDPVCPESGDQFNPEIHEAVARRETQEAPSQTVHRLFRRGYRDAQGLLRAALVEVNVEASHDDVSEGSPEPGQDSPDDDTSSTDSGSTAGKEGEGLGELSSNDSESSDVDSESSDVDSETSEVECDDSVSRRAE